MTRWPSSLRMRVGRTLRRRRPTWPSSSETTATWTVPSTCWSGSLGYRARERIDETEIVTRIALAQALEAGGCDPERIFEVAEPLFSAFWPDMRPDQHDGTVGPVRQAVERHLSAHPELDGQAWTAKRFPLLAG